MVVPTSLPPNCGVCGLTNLGRSWVEDHTLVLLNPSNVAIQGRPNPRKMIEKVRLEICFPVLCYSFSNLFVFGGLFVVGLDFDEVRRFQYYFFTFFPTQQRLEIANTLFLEIANTLFFFLFFFDTFPL